MVNHHFAGLIMLVLAAVICAGCTSEQAGSARGTPDAINETMSMLTLEEKCGQMLLVGFRGFSADPGSVLS